MSPATAALKWSTGKIRYTPAANSPTPVTFTYQVTDADDDAASATVTVTITDDEPVIT